MMGLRSYVEGSDGKRHGIPIFWDKKVVKYEEDLKTGVAVA